MLVALVALLAAPAAAQRRIGAEPFVYVGYSRAWFTGGDEEAGSQTVNGTVGGLGLRVPVLSFLAGRVDLMLTRKGGQFRFPATAPGEEDAFLNLEFVYLELPLVVQVQRYAAGTGFRPFAYAGVAPSFQLGCDLEVVVPDLAVARGACDDSTALGGTLEFISPDVGLVGAVGVEWRLPSAVLQAQLRYTNGWRPITDDSRLRNRTIALLVGVGI